MGCIYTAQGFEYDYVGVIFGMDLRYDPRAGTWIGDPSASFDAVVKRSGATFVNLEEHLPRTAHPRHEGLLRVLPG